MSHGGCVESHHVACSGELMGESKSLRKLGEKREGGGGVESAEALLLKPSGSRLYPCRCRLGMSRLLNMVSNPWQPTEEFFVFLRRYAWPPFYSINKSNSFSTRLEAIQIHRLLL